MRISRAVLWVCLWALASLLLGSPSSASAQYRLPVDAEMIQSMMPLADSFSTKAGLPPVYTAYGTGADGSPGVIGYVYLTANVPPIQYGYSGPIDVLVGMDLTGHLTGATIVNYRESLSSSRGDFLRRGRLTEQLVGKHIGERFQVRRDLDGISGASISATAMFRGIRNSARRVALSYLQPGESTASASAGALEDLTWLEMISTGYIQMMAIERYGAGLDLSFAYMGDEALGGLLMGLVRYQDISERVEGLKSDDHVMLVGIDGSAVAGFRSNGFAVRQGGEAHPVPSRRVTFLGTPYEGKAADQVQYTLIMRMDSTVVLDEPFTVVYDDGTNPESTMEYRVPEEVLAAVRERAAAARELVDAETGAAELGVEESTAVVPAVSANGSNPVSTDGSVDVSAGGSAAVPVPATTTDPASAESADGIGAPGAVTAEPVTSELAAGAPTDGSAAPLELTVPEGVLDLSVAPSDVPAADDASTGAQSIPGLDFSSFEDFEDETALSQLLLETRWAPVVRLILLLGLVLYAFFSKSGRVGAVALGATFVYLGFIDGGFLSVSHITSGIIVGPGVYLRDMAVLVMIAFTVVTTLLWGRVFCGFLCPFGALQDFITRIVPRRFQWAVPQRIHDRAIYLKYGILLLIVGLAALPAQIAVYQYFEPFGTVFYRSTSPLLLSIAGGFLVASAVV
ncbi:MAG: 4Fe-4S binding protein, partial [Gemmatimonadota bacterium]|nr:4Fe-4S binding protein [Gemmatimonadota bacterium]